MKNIGLRVKQLRKEQGLSQEELAERAGVHLKTVNNLESGRHSTSIDVLVKVVEALGAKVIIAYSKQIQ